MENKNDFRRNQLKDYMSLAIDDEYDLRSYVEEAVINVNHQIRNADARGMFDEPHGDIESEGSELSSEASSEASSDVQGMEVDSPAPAAPPAPPPAAPPPQFTYYPNARDLESDFKQAEEDPNDDYEECTFKHVEKKYRREAESTLLSIREHTHYLKAQDISEILMLRTLTQIKPEKLEIEDFSVKIDHKNITFTLISSKYQFCPTIEFMDTEGGCNVRENKKYNEVKLVRHVNYQQLAASSFVYIIRSNKEKFEKLRFTIQATRDVNPAIFPFQTFLSSIDMYLEMQNVRIESTEFSLESHRNYTSKYFARSFIQTIIPHFDPEILESISIQLWGPTAPEAQNDRFMNGNERDISVVRRIFGTEQWKQATEVYIGGEILEDEDYSEFCHFQTVRMQFPPQNRQQTEQQFRRIVKSFQKLKSYDKPHKCTYEVLEDYYFKIDRRDGWTLEGDKLSTVLSNGVKLDLQKKEVVFTIIPRQLELAAKKPKKPSPNMIESVLTDLYTKDER